MADELPDGISLTRVFDAPRERLWREWTEPAQVRVERQAASSEPLFGEREEEEAFEEDDLEIPDFLRT